MKYDVFDVPIGLLREWSMCADRISDSGRFVQTGIKPLGDMFATINDDDFLVGLYVMAESWATFDCYRFGGVSVYSLIFETEDEAQRYCDEGSWVDIYSDYGALAHGFGYESEIWHVVGDAPSGLCPSGPAGDSCLGESLVPDPSRALSGDLPLTLDALRQLRDAGELGDSDDLTDEDFLPTTYRGDLPLATVTRSDFGCVFLPSDNVMLYGCEWVHFVPRDHCPGCFLFEDTMTFHLSDRTGIWNMLVNAYSDLDGDGWYNNYEDEIRTLCRELFFGPKSDGGCNPLWFCCHDELERLGLDLKFGFDFGPARYEYNPPAPVAVSQDDAYWDTLLSPPDEDEDFDDWFDSLVEHAAPVPVNTWHEIDIQCELPEVL